LKEFVSPAKQTFDPTCDGLTYVTSCPYILYFARTLVQYIAVKNIGTYRKEPKTLFHKYPEYIEQEYENRSQIRVTNDFFVIRTMLCGLIAHGYTSTNGQSTCDEDMHGNSGQEDFDTLPLSSTFHNTLSRCRLSLLFKCRSVQQSIWIGHDQNTRCGHSPSTCPTPTPSLEWQHLRTRHYPSSWFVEYLTS
jgi:hypothetical protein